MTYLKLESGLVPKFCVSVLHRKTPLESSHITSENINGIQGLYLHIHVNSSFPSSLTTILRPMHLHSSYTGSLEAPGSPTYT